MSLIFSPSNLKTFVQCPYKFKAMNIDKSVPYVQNEAAKRGEQLHSLMETAVNYGWKEVQWTDTKSEKYAHGFIDTVWALKNKGWDVKTEVSVATDGYGNSVDYWAKAPQNFLRCRIDLYATNPAMDYVLVLDWKSGQVYDADKLQLQANAICLRDKLHVNKYLVGFAYLDSGKVKYENVDVTGVDLKEKDPLKFASSSCLELMNAVDGATRAISMNKFIPCKNRFCKWCAVKDCQYAGV